MVALSIAALPLGVTAAAAWQRAEPGSARATISAAPSPDHVPPRATTTLAAPPPTTATTSTTVPPPAPTTTAPPVPPAPTPPPPPTAPIEEVRASYLASVPAAWRGAIEVDLAVIGGSTSWSYPSGRIEVSTSHHSRGSGVLATTLAHEFGHLISHRYGTRAFNGAAPAGWPAYSGRPEEAWADCVAQAFTGLADPSHGLPACPAATLQWTQAWLGSGPDAHPRTG
jgi:hypothetical protein